MTSPDPSPEVGLRQRFARYFADYADAFNAFDAPRIAAFFHTPCLMVSAGAVVVVESQAAIESHVEALLRHHRAQGFGRVVVDRLAVRAQATNLAIATVHWRVTRPDESLLWSFEHSYNLADQGSGWKILVSTTHDAARA